MSHSIAIHCPKLLSYLLFKVGNVHNEHYAGPKNLSGLFCIRNQQVRALSTSVSSFTCLIVYCCSNVGREVIAVLIMKKNCVLSFLEKENSSF